MAAQPKHTHLSTQEKLRSLRDALLDGLIERDDAVRLALLAAITGEHLLLIGPPGTAKSLVATRLREAFAGATFFQKLMTRFTVPEEVFGPFSIRGLEEDRYERKTERYLPTASVAFLDEIFKANSAILNSMLTLLNEREFDNGTARVKTPLVAVIGASNELPEGEGELDALYDRFLLRLHVGPVPQARFTDLLRVRAPGEVAPRLRLDNGDLVALQKLANEVLVPGEVLMLLGDLREWCAAHDIVVSDRRWLKIVKLLRASAATNGRDTVSIWDCWLLQHCIWSDPKDREAIYDWYADRVGTSVAMDPSRLTRIVVAGEKMLDRDRKSRSQAFDDEGRPLFKSHDGTPTHDATGRQHSPHLVSTPHKPVYIEGRLRELDELEGDVESYIGELDGHIASMATEIQGHLWVDADFAEPAARTLARSRENVVSLLERVWTLRAGFEALPREESTSLTAADAEGVGSEEE